MNSSKVAIVTNIIIGKFLSIVGYTVGSFFLLAFFMHLFDGTIPSSSKGPGIIACLIIIGISILLIIKGAKIKRLLKRFKIYVNLISTENMTSLENIASRTSQSIDFVKDDINTMINKKLFKNAYLDIKTNELIVSKQNATTPQNNVQTIATVLCPGCGASNSKQKGLMSSCEYCGSPLK